MTLLYAATAHSRFHRRSSPVNGKRRKYCMCSPCQCWTHHYRSLPFGFGSTHRSVYKSGQRKVGLEARSACMYEDVRFGVGRCLMPKLKDRVRVVTISVHTHFVAPPHRSPSKLMTLPRIHIAVSHHNSGKYYCTDDIRFASRIQ